MEGLLKDMDEQQKQQVGSWGVDKGRTHEGSAVDHPGTRKRLLALCSHWRHDRASQAPTTIVRFTVPDFSFMQIAAVRRVLRSACRVTGLSILNSPCIAPSQGGEEGGPRGGAGSPPGGRSPPPIFLGVVGALGAPAWEDKQPDEGGSTTSGERWGQHGPQHVLSVPGKVLAWRAGTRCTAALAPVLPHANAHATTRCASLDGTAHF